MSLTGTVKKFVTDKRFGFIAPEEGGADVFIHINQCNGADSLSEGDKVRYDNEWNDHKGKMQGVNVTVVRSVGGGGDCGGGYIDDCGGGEGGKGQNGAFKTDVMVEVTGLAGAHFHVQGNPSERICNLRKSIAQSMGINQRELLLVDKVTYLDDWEVLGQRRQVTAVRASPEHVVKARGESAAAIVLAKMRNRKDLELAGAPLRR